MCAKEGTHLQLHAGSVMGNTFPVSIMPMCLGTVAAANARHPRMQGPVVPALEAPATWLQAADSSRVSPTRRLHASGAPHTPASLAKHRPKKLLE